MPGLHFGNYTLETLSDGCIYFDPVAMFPSVPEEELGGACAAHGLASGEKLGCFLTSYLIRGGDRSHETGDPHGPGHDPLERDHGRPALLVP